jgi:hypothetical protein
MHRAVEHNPTSVGSSEHVQLPLACVCLRCLQRGPRAPGCSCLRRKLRQDQVQWQVCLCDRAQDGTRARVLACRTHPVLNLQQACCVGAGISWLYCPCAIAGAAGNSVARLRLHGGGMCRCGCELRCVTACRHGLSGGAVQVIAR